MITKSSCGRKPSWRLFTCGAPKEKVLKSVLLNIFINGFDDRVESILTKFADGTKLRGVADTQEGCAAIQGDLNRQEKWAEQNLMQLNKEQCRLLPSASGEKQPYTSVPGGGQVFLKQP